MSRPLRIVLLLTLPLLTLFLGLHLGLNADQLLEWEESSLPLPITASGGSVTLQDPEQEVKIGLLWEVWRLLLRRYVTPEQLHPTPMFYGAIRGLVEAVGDPYTAFMTPQEYGEFRDALQGELQGIGAELALRKGGIVIVAPLRGSPAERSGLLPGDMIVAVDGESLGDVPLAEAVRRIRGPKGSRVTLSILREEAPLSFTIVREDIRVPSTEYELKSSRSGPIAYIAINQFGDATVREVTEVLQDAKKAHVIGLIVDVRHNGGGYLDGAVSLVSLFLRQGKVVSVKGRGDVLSHHYVSGRPLLPDLPMVIMVNQGSASAAEILAGALQDHERATIIGMKSFGKGTVQEVIDLSGGGSLRVTTAHWLLPSGRNLAKEGITPDIVIDRTLEDIEQERDPQLEAAMKWFEDGSPKQPTQPRIPK